jgi:sugar phosphate isomerase/epimerase
VDWKRIFQTLKDAGVSGPCVLENFTAKEQSQIVEGARRSREHLEQVISELS